MVTSNWCEPESEKEKNETTKHDHASGLGTSLSALPGRSPEVTTAPNMGRRLSRRDTFIVDNGPAAEHVYASVRKDAYKVQRYESTCKPYKSRMPNPGGKDANVWDGTSATLNDDLRWFEREAADCAVHSPDMIRICLEYFDSRKVEALEE